MDYDDTLYGREKLGQAASALVGRGDIRNRLYHAYIDGLHVLCPENLPEGLREDFAALQEAFTWVPVESEGEGALVSTLRAMGDEEAERLANQVLDMYARIIEDTGGGADV